VGADGHGVGSGAGISIKLQFRFHTLRPMQKMGENHIFQQANKSQ